MTSIETEYCSFCDPDNETLWIETSEPAIMRLDPFKGGCTTGHTMFVPREHVVRDRVLAPLTMQVALDYARDEGIEDFNLILNCGDLASQTVRHDHLHLVPRRADDGLQLPWSGESKYVEMYRSMKAMNSRIQTRLQEHASSLGVAWTMSTAIPGIRPLRAMWDVLDDIVKEARRAG